MDYVFMVALVSMPMTAAVLAVFIWGIVQISKINRPPARYRPIDDPDERP